MSKKSLYPLICVSLALLFLAMFNYSCKKDYEPVPQKITVEKAKKWFDSVGDRNPTSSLHQGLYPMWYRSEVSMFQGNQEILIVPATLRDSLIDVGNQNDIKLVVYVQGNGELDGCILVHQNTPNQVPDVENYTGYITTFKMSNGDPLCSVQVVDGQLVAEVTDLEGILAMVASPSCDDGGGCPPWIHWICELFGISHVHCPSAGGSSGSGAGSGSGGFGGGGNSGSGGSGGTITGPAGGIIYVGNGGIDIVIGEYYTGNNSGSGSASNSLSNFFENEIFGNESMFNHPNMYPCRNQNLHNPDGEGVFASFLLKAKANGLANMMTQWLELVASGQYSSPADALGDINWTEVNASDTNDYMDGSPSNNVLLQAAIAVLNQTEAQGCDVSVDQAWDVLSRHNSQLKCAMDMASMANGIPETSFSWLLNNLDVACTFKSFLQTNSQNNTAPGFVKDFIARVIADDLSFWTFDDMNVMFNHPDFWEAYQDFLDQNPAATEEQKLFALRFFVEAPKKPITNLPQRLNCFYTPASNQNNAQVQSVALYVDQPIANSDKIIDDRSGPFTKVNTGAGHAWLCITQQINNVTTTLNVGLYPAVSINSITTDPVQGAFNDDENHPFDVFVRWDNLDDQTFNQLITNLRTFSTAPSYDLNDFSCVHWATGELSKIGFEVPLTPVPFPFPLNVDGYSPARLAQDLRNNQPPNTYMNTTGGNSVPSSCQ